MSNWTIALTALMVIIMIGVLWFAYAIFQKTKARYRRTYGLRKAELDA